MILTDKCKIVDDSQKVKRDAGKARLSLVNPLIMYAISKTREFGILKYKDRPIDSWKSLSMNRVHEALLRHTASMQEDVWATDEETGLPSVWHVAFNCMVIIYLMWVKHPEKMDEYMSMTWGDSE